MSEITELAHRLVDRDFEAARAARRVMWKLVRRAGRPGAAEEKSAVARELIQLLGEAQPAAVLREALWMLSEIGGDESVGPIASLLSSREAREDARMALQRIPGEKSLAALQAALVSAPADFQINIAGSLRARGVEVQGLPCQKLRPVKPTKVMRVPG